MPKQTEAVPPLSQTLSLTLRWAQAKQREAVQRMKSFCEDGDRCRRLQLLAHFGEGSG
jgi:superfamily II DNA helicase RecQ